MVFLMKRYPGLMLGVITLLAGQIITSLPAMAAPRRPIVIHDNTQTDRSFADFATKLKQAIRDRDTKYITSILPSQGIAIGFSRPTSIADLKLNNANSRFWGILEYTTKPGCDRSLLDTKVWLCAPVAQDFHRQYPAPANRQGIEYDLENVIIIGQTVNVRSQPNLNGRVIAQLTNEVVAANRQVKGIFDPNPLIGWTPVVLPDGRSGYVNNRYAYFPLGVTLQITKVNHQWQITQVLAGD
jgi:hypothetical protein